MVGSCRVYRSNPAEIAALLRSVLGGIQPVTTDRSCQRQDLQAVAAFPRGIGSMPESKHFREFNSCRTLHLGHGSIVGRGRQPAVTGYGVAISQGDSGERQGGELLCSRPIFRATAAGAGFSGGHLPSNCRLQDSPNASSEKGSIIVRADILYYERGG